MFYYTIIGLFPLQIREIPFLTSKKILYFATKNK